MAYGRRKARENIALAAAIGGVLAMRGVPQGRPVADIHRKGPRWVSPSALLAEMGVKL